MAQEQKKETYWQKRSLDSEKAINDQAKQVESVITRAYRQGQLYLTRKVRELFSRSKERSGLSEEEARNLLNSWMPGENIVELRKLAKDISNPEIQEAAQKRLSALAFKERITRAEDLKAKAYLVAKQVADVQLDKQTEFYIDAIHKSYNEASAEATIRKLEQSGVTIETWNKNSHRHEFKELSTRYTKNILESHWKGSNYSKRLWSDTDALAKRLEELFTVESMTGMSEFEMAKTIAYEFDRSIGVARRLIRTEANYMAGQAKLKAWRDGGVEHYRLVVVLDLRTSDICQKKSKENKVYKVIEAVVNGAEGNYPPFHPWCRTIAVIFLGKVRGNRIANDPISNQTMTMAQAATYDDWMNKLKEKYSDEEIELQKKKIKNIQKDNADYRRLKDVLGKEYAPKSLDNYQNIKYNEGEDWQQLKRKYSLQKSINNGNLTTQLHLESQQRHELGHPRYDKYVEKNKKRGRPTPSYITTDVETLQKIVNDRYLSGKIDRKKPGQALIEIEIDTDEYGVAYDRLGLNPSATNRYKIHMSKVKTHIVPMHPTEGK